MHNPTQYLLCNNPGNLQTALAALTQTATVEAEFGDVCVEGSVVTLAHHGIRSHQPCPCLYDGPRVVVDAVGLSHVDLDALGGILALEHSQPGPTSFWQFAAFVDTNGVHRVHQAGASAEDVLSLHAWWAWNERQENRLWPPRDGSVLDASDWVERASRHLDRIFAGNEEALAEGARFAAATETHDRESFVQATANVLVRRDPRFVNHLYTHEGRVYRAVVGHNTETGAITVSWESPTDASRWPAVGIVRELWGELAGGHAGIAGSPRGAPLGNEVPLQVAERIERLLNA